MYYKKIFAVVFLSFVIVIVLLQIQKRTQYSKDIEKKTEAQLKSKSEFVKLLDQIPIYRDSTFKIYIARFDTVNKIVFLKKDSITEIQKGSNFFLHIYPLDEELLKDTNSNFLAFDFKNDNTIFTFRDTKYFISSTDLPDFEINKINTGQYGFDGNNDITWQVESILKNEDICKILEYNKEPCY